MYERIPGPFSVFYLLSLGKRQSAKCFFCFFFPPWYFYIKPAWYYKLLIRELMLNHFHTNHSLPFSMPVRLKGSTFFSGSGLDKFKYVLVV